MSSTKEPTKKKKGSSSQPNTGPSPTPTSPAAAARSPEVTDASALPVVDRSLLPLSGTSQDTALAVVTATSPTPPTTPRTDEWISLRTYFKATDDQALAKLAADIGVDEMAIPHLRLVDQTQLQMAYSGNKITLQDFNRVTWLSNYLLTQPEYNVSAMGVWDLRSEIDAFRGLGSPKSVLVVSPPPATIPADNTMKFVPSSASVTTPVTTPLPSAPSPLGDQPWTTVVSPEGPPPSGFGSTILQSHKFTNIKFPPLHDIWGYLDFQQACQEWCMLHRCLHLLDPLYTGPLDTDGNFAFYRAMKVSIQESTRYSSLLTSQPLQRNGRALYFALETKVLSGTNKKVLIQRLLREISNASVTNNLVFEALNGLSNQYNNMAGLDLPVPEPFQICFLEMMIK